MNDMADQYPFDDEAASGPSRYSEREADLLILMLRDRVRRQSLTIRALRERLDIMETLPGHHSGSRATRRTRYTSA